MKSETLPSFWAEYRKLSNPIRERARKTYRLWADNPFHPSLHFKCIDSNEGIWSIRVTRSYRGVGFWTVAWFWIGSHGDYEQFY